MPLSRPPDSSVPTLVGRPAWLTAGLARLGILCAFIVAIGMIRPRLTHDRAELVLIVGGAVVAGGALAFYLVTRRLAHRLPLMRGPQRAAEAVLLVLRKTGLPLLGLAFFLLWTFVYLGLWWYDPDEAAFAGLAEAPRFADFFYYAVTTAVISPPGDIVAVSRGARSATMIEMVTGFALLATYLSSFMEFRGSQRETGA